MATDFERFFWEEWPRMLDAVSVDKNHSWEDRAFAVDQDLHPGTYRKEWEHLMEEALVPHEHMQQPQDQETSWDRRAAWLVFRQLLRQGRVWLGPAQSELF